MNGTYQQPVQQQELRKVDVREVLIKLHRHHRYKPPPRLQKFYKLRTVLHNYGFLRKLDICDWSCDRVHREFLMNYFLEKQCCCSFCSEVIKHWNSHAIATLYTLLATFCHSNPPLPKDQLFAIMSWYKEYKRACKRMMQQPQAAQISAPVQPDYLALLSILSTLPNDNVYVLADIAHTGKRILQVNKSYQILGFKSLDDFFTAAYASKSACRCSRSIEREFLNIKFSDFTRVLHFGIESHEQDHSDDSDPDVRLNRGNLPPNSFRKSFAPAVAASAAGAGAAAATGNQLNFSTQSIPGNIQTSRKSFESNLAKQKSGKFSTPRSSLASKSVASKTRQSMKQQFDKSNPVHLQTSSESAEHGSDENDKDAENQEEDNAIEENEEEEEVSSEDSDPNDDQGDDAQNNNTENFYLENFNSSNCGEIRQYLDICSKKAVGLMFKLLINHELEFYLD